MQLSTYTKRMKPNISLASKESPCFPPVKTVLGQLPQRKIVPNPNSNSNDNPNPNPNRGTIFLGGNCLDTGKNKRNEKPKRNKK